MNEDMVTATEMKKNILDSATKNALLFEDSTFTEEQNNLAYVFTADPLANYKDADMVSYLGVANGDTDLVIDLNSNLDFSKFLKLYPDDKPEFSIEFLKKDIQEKYSKYINLDPVTGLINIATAKDIKLPADTKLEMIEFVGVGKTSKTTIKSNTIFYFHSNSWEDEADYESLEADVTLAMTDVNSISFFVTWASSLK